MYYNIEGLKDEDVGRIMAKWAYIGVGVGLLATYSYLGIMKTNKQKLYEKSRATYEFTRPGA